MTKLGHLERLLVIFWMSKLQPAGIIFQGACIQSGAVTALLPYYFKLFSLVTVLPLCHGQSDKGYNIFGSFQWLSTPANNTSHCKTCTCYSCTVLMRECSMLFHRIRMCQWTNKINTSKYRPQLLETISYSLSYIEIIIYLLKSLVP